MGAEKSGTGKFYVGFDLGGTKMLAVVYDHQFRPVGRSRKKTRPDGGEPSVDRIIKTINEALKEANVDRSSLAGIGVGVPGPLDLDEGVLLESPNLGWKNVPLRKLLESEFKCPTVVANDVDLGVYGEHRHGAGRQANIVLGVFPGTGIGGGLVYNGQIYRGKKGSCLEVGHVPVMFDGPRCACGRRGCLEAVASRLAVASQAAISAARGEAPNLFKVAGADVSKIRSGTLADAIKAGDVVVEKIVRHAARQIGLVVGGLVNLLMPEKVVLGGGMVEAMTDLFVTGVSEAARAHVLPSFQDSYEIVAAKLGDDAAAIGAASWAQARFGGGGKKS